MSVEISGELSIIVEIIRGLGSKYSQVTSHPFIGVLNPNGSSEGVQLVFDGHVPKRLSTPDGSYPVAGPDLDGNIVKFLECLGKRCNIKTVSPRQSDYSKDVGYPFGYSGPIIGLSIKQPS